MKCDFKEGMPFLQKQSCFFATGCVLYGIRAGTSTCDYLCSNLQVVCISAFVPICVYPCVCVSVLLSHALYPQVRAIVFSLCVEP